MRGAGRSRSRFCGRSDPHCYNTTIARRVPFLPFARSFRRMAQHDPSARKAHLSFERLESRLALSGTGLTAQYFHSSDFTGLADIRTEGVSHNWGSGSPGAGIDPDSFSVRWTGQVMPQYSQTYTFNVLSDEGVRVWVDGKMLVDDWIPHVRRNQSGTIALQANQL